MLPFSLGQDLGLGLGIRVASISPAALFANGEQGIWLDPSDLSTLFQDSSGTTPVTADGDPVGLIRDKSGNGNHASQATAASRPVYKTDGTKSWLLFDGSDDFLVTPSIDFTGGDEITVIAGLYKLSDGSAGVVAELSANVNANNGSFRLGAPGLSGDVSMASRGTVTVSNFVPWAVSVPVVVTGRTKIGKPLMDLRGNGVVLTSNVTSQGSGNFGNYPLYIGRRGGASAALNGRLHGLITRSALTTDPMLSQAERWMAGKTGVIW